MMTSTIPDTQTITQDFLQWLSHRKLNPLVELFADEVDWYIPGDQQKAEWLGRRNNKSEIEDFFRVLWANTEPLAANIEYVHTNDDHAMIAGSFVTKMLKTGKIVDSLFFIHFRCRDGKIVFYRLLEDSLAVWRAL
jgi:hypothetical protein